MLTIGKILGAGLETKYMLYLSWEAGTGSNMSYVRFPLNGCFDR